MDNTPAPLRLRSIEDLLNVIPYLIGYHPTDSVVCVAVRDRRTPVLVNTPLASIDADGADETATDVAAARVAAHVVGEADTAIVVGYGTPEQVDAVLAKFELALRAFGVDVMMVVRSTGRRYCCLTAGCDTCPAGSVAYDPDTSLIAVRAVMAGHTALPDRAAVAALLNPVEGLRRVQMDAACRRASRRLQAMLQDPAPVGGTGPSHRPGSWTGPGMPVPWPVAEAGIDALHGALRAAEQGQVLSDDEVGWLAVVLRIAVVQAAAWRSSTNDTWQRQLWTDVVRRATPALTAVPAALLASTAYHAGNGTLATFAVQRALQVDPGNGFAHVLEHALAAGMPPAEWRAALRAATSG